MLILPISPGGPDSPRHARTPPHPKPSHWANDSCSLAPLKYLKEVSCWQPWEPSPAHPSMPRPDLSTSFPAIGTAYAVLSNPEKRKQYDQFGDDKSQAARHGHGHGDFHRGFEADISPEDLFNMFFGGGFPSSESPYTPHSRVSPGAVVGDWVPASPVPAAPLLTQSL